MRVDSVTMALDSKTLRLTLDEYKRFRVEDATIIKRLGVKIKNLEVVVRHEVEVAVSLTLLSAIRSLCGIRCRC